MLSTGLLKMAGGVACILFSWWVIGRLSPREGKPPSAWTSTDLRASALAMVLVVLIVAGAALIAQAALS
jgi:hypothetical protein